MIKVFIDGSNGTTGLRLRERIEKRDDVELITLPDEIRKDPGARADAINSSDVTFLCLPDDAAGEAVSLVKNDRTVVIDTSTARRTLAPWAYGFPELAPDFEDKIRAGKRIAVPGCHASGFIALARPLVEAGIIAPDAPLNCFSLTGYSGGGKKMIKEYESDGRPAELDSPRVYGIGQTHKHLKEMKIISGVTREPVFIPVVSDFYSGMEVTVPLFADQVRGGVETIKQIYREKYNTKIVYFSEDAGEDGFMASNALSGKDSMEISVKGNEERILLVARYDNLGKGASGAALECFNLVTGNDPEKGLVL